jgi:hypothetical protein
MQAQLESQCDEESPFVCTIKDYERKDFRSEVWIARPSECDIISHASSHCED